MTGARAIATVRGMTRLMVLVVVGLAACAEEQAPFDGPAPYLLTQQTISRTFVSKRLAPNVMVLADSSSAMATGSRLTQLQSALNTVLTSADAVHQRWGLTTFPAATTTVALPVETGADHDPELAAKASAVNAALQALAPSGATDTLGALQFTGDLASLNANDNRPDVIVLLTGGVPGGAPQATIDLLTTLRLEHSISTIVVAFSPEAGSEAVFDAMARAGGAPRRCEETDDGVCARAFYDETNATALLEPLQPIVLIDPDPCLFQLAVVPDYVSVVLDGVTLSAGLDTYRLDGAQLRLTGAACERVHDATQLDPATVTIRVVEKQ